jgi:hypothetical protein
MSDPDRRGGKPEAVEAGFKEPFLHFTYTVDM